jgi:hypothetical protein
MRAACDLISRVISLWTPRAGPVSQLLMLRQAALGRERITLLQQTAACVCEGPRSFVQTTHLQTSDHDTVVQADLDRAPSRHRVMRGIVSLQSHGDWHISVVR